MLCVEKFFRCLKYWECYGWKKGIWNGWGIKEEIKRRKEKFKEGLKDLMELIFDMNLKTKIYL